MTIRKGPLAIAIDIAAGRLASGDPTEDLIENVKVSCHACGGVTVFPVFKYGGVRPAPAPCSHCGTDV
jgi:hypothetical protein